MLCRNDGWLFVVPLMCFVFLGALTAYAEQNEKQPHPPERSAFLLLNVENQIPENWPSQSHPEYRGCCSHHGGVCGCSGGSASCCDGAISPTCGCN